jgi:hypothetical protein
MTAMAATPFAPEIPHAELELARVEVRELLPGDGYDEYLKPFRTIEDCAVHAALLAYAIGVARRNDWPRAALERLVAALVTARAIASADPRSAAVHVALAGLLESTRALTSELSPHWDLVESGERARWQRDQGLVGVAGRARDARREKAWETLLARSAGARKAISS